MGAATRRTAVALAALLLPAIPVAAPAAAVRDADPLEARIAELSAELDRDRRSPRGLVPLAGLLDAAAEAPVLARVAEPLARAAEDRRAHPEVRALARFRLAGLERARGSFQRSAALLGRLGFVGGWRIAGPFDGEGRRGHDAVYPPEEGIDLGATMAGKVREVGWRDLPAEAHSHGFVDLGAVLRPSREVVAYALAAVVAPREERVRLRLGASGAAKVWVNGALALSDPGHHPARLDQRGASVTLRQGPNRILVKLSHDSGRMGFFLRLEDERGDGRTLAAGDPASPAPASGPAPAPLDGALAALERGVAAARGARARAAAHRDLAIALDERRAADAGEARALAEARRAVELEPRSVEARLLAARLEEDHGRRRLHLDAALAVDPENAEALLALAREELDQDRPHAAVRLLDRAFAAAPGWAAPRVLRVEAVERVGLAARAALLAEEEARRFPTVPAAVRAAARAARRLGRLEEAAGRFRTLLALRLDDAEARSSLVQLLADAGDVAGAAALVEEGLRLDPADVRERAALGQLLAANGRSGEAEAAFAAALALAPEDADVLERRGRARLAAGRRADARADLARALELRPQSPELKGLLRSLEPAREPFERPYLLDARALAASAPAPREDEDAIVLGELKVTRVLPSGLSADVHQTVVKVLTARGADSHRQQAIGWVPDRQEMKVERARVWKPDGTAVDAYDEAERSGSEPWYRLYYDTRVTTLSFPTLAPGDVLEVAWRVEDVAGENLLSDYFGDLTFVEGGTRKARFDWVILAPAPRPLHALVPAGVERTERALEGGLVEHRFAARDVPRVVSEPAMPGWSEVARFVHVSTYASWEEVARFYWGLVKEQLRPTEELRRTAARLAAEVLGRPPGTPVAPPPGGWDERTKRALVAAAYGFVVSQTRYVGLEFGIHGFKPYRVDDVLRRRFGDCKDKAGLLHALLSSLGIDSRIVLLRMKRLGRIPESPASLAVFNHAILHVPDLDLWLDGTASHTGSRELPGEDRGASVLVVNPGASAWFGTVPEAPAGANRTETRFDVSIAPDGSAEVRGRSRVTGAQAPQYRRAYLSEHDRKAQLEKAFNRIFPGLAVRSLALSDLGRLEEDVTLEFALDVPRYAEREGEGMRFGPFGRGTGFVESFAPLSSRRHALVLGEPWENRFTYRFDLPPGFAVAEAPEDVTVEGGGVFLAVRHRVEGASLVVEGRVAFEAGRVPAEGYAAFREAAAAVDRAFARRVRIAPAPATTGGRP